MFVRDLLRPRTADEVEELVKAHAGEETEFNQQLLRQSLHAALTLDELANILASLDLPTAGLSQTSDRHWTWNLVKSDQDSAGE